MPGLIVGPDEACARSTSVPDVHDDRTLVEERIRRELWERVLPLVHRDAIPLTVRAGRDLDHVEPFTVGNRWGTPWGTTWFLLEGDVPEYWTRRVDSRVEAFIDLGFHDRAAGFQCEGLVVDDHGRPVQGIHPRRTGVVLEPTPGPVTIRVEAASNPSFPQFVPPTMGGADARDPDGPLLYRFRRADLVLVDREAEALAHDLDVADGVMRTLPLTDPRRAKLRTAVVAALDALAGNDPDVARARHALAPALSVPARASAHRMIATGHAHIDTAWLWPIEETIRKCTRTFASAVRLLDERPEYVFSCSQAQQYAWIEERHPELFADITRHVAEGRWVPVGGMWVESDMNLPSGESIVRQIVHGQRWFEDRFGVRSTEMWIPDVFGYPATLPQIFAAGGMTRFVTQKLSWNKQNRFPHHTFWWEGLDGTRVLTHFPPVDTYNAEITPEECAHASDSFREHAWSDWSLLPFGHGDGGGGPTREMLERADRLADLDGAPWLEIGSPAAFFEHVEREIRQGAPAPVWRGELYFETHRGTLTSQARTKLGNRRCERLLREVELWAATAGESADVDHLWREILTQQFHDILPGSSIGWVHADAEAVHARVARELEGRRDALLDRLAPTTPSLANTSSHPFDGVAVVDLDRFEGGFDDAFDDGRVQRLSDGRLAARVWAPGVGLAPFEPAATEDRVVVTERSLVNGHLAVRLDHEGNLASVIDVVRAREVLPDGHAGAVLELAPDHPVQYDAWDLEAWTPGLGRPLGAPERVEVLDDGPLAGRIRVTRSVGPSRFTVTYSLRADSARLDVDVEVDWQHREHLLSMRFPLDVRADTAACDVQFGVVHRPTHGSSPWDAAKFEVCAHRYVDVAEPGFGVAVFADGRDGHGVFEGGVRVSLLRAPHYPDPDADRGLHSFRHALLPHGGDPAEVAREAEWFTRPVSLVRGSADVRARPVVELDGHGVELDAVKPADDGSGDVIVRLHEHVGARRPVVVTLPGRRVTAASRCDLLEEPRPDGALEVGDGVAVLTLRPFELVTLRLTPG